MTSCDSKFHDLIIRSAEINLVSVLNLSSPNFIIKLLVFMFKSGRKKNQFFFSML